LQGGFRWLRGCTSANCRTTSLLLGARSVLLIEISPARTLCSPTPTRAYTRDLQAAHELGMKCIVVTGNKPVYDFSSADLVVRDLSQINMFNLKRLFSEEELVQSRWGSWDLTIWCLRVLLALLCHTCPASLSCMSLSTALRKSPWQGTFTSFAVPSSEYRKRKQECYVPECPGTLLLL